MTIIKIELGKKEILKQFRECETGSINLETNKGFIYLVGGILCKNEGNKHYLAYRGTWRLV